MKRNNGTSLSKESLIFLFTCSLLLLLYAINFISETVLNRIKIILYLVYLGLSISSRMRGSSSQTIIRGYQEVRGEGGDKSDGRARKLDA